MRLGLGATVAMCLNARLCSLVFHSFGGLTPNSFEQDNCTSLQVSKHSSHTYTVCGMGNVVWE